MINSTLKKTNSIQTRKLNYASLITLVIAFFGSINNVQALPDECANLQAPVTFIESTGIVCLQNIKVTNESATFFSKAALQWLGAENPNQFSIVDVENDIASENNNSSFSVETGTLEIPMVDIPKTFGTERYSANLVLKHENGNNIFELASTDIYINPDYVPNVTWKPYTMLSPKEKRNVNILGESIPFAKLANAVYNFETLTVDNWELIEQKSKSSGMQAGIYKNKDTNELVLAFRGTEFCKSIFDCSTDELLESGRDVLADTQLTLGFNGKQFPHAYEFAQDVANRYQGQTITVTGHSLGGGLAQAIGSAFGVKTFAFNSAPVPEDFLDVYPTNLSIEELSNIIHVIADIHDPVSNTDESGDFYLNAAHISSLIQFDFGQRETLPDPLAELDALRFNKHGMSTFIDNASELLSIYRDGW